jgi:hypothetical protein
MMRLKHLDVFWAVDETLKGLAVSLTHKRLLLPLSTWSQSNHLPFHLLLFALICSSFVLKLDNNLDGNCLNLSNLDPLEFN